jgi:acetyl-CoA carboxylase carboxyl transferase subunit alpha
MNSYLDFEKPIAQLENKIEELRLLSRAGDSSLTTEIIKIEEKSSKLLRQIYKELTPWQKTMVARHQDRPKFFDYLNSIFTNFLPLAGDRTFGDDQALIGGLCSLGTQSVVVMGQQKGTDTDSRIKHNFGMARPEGYRKAQRLMKLADKFNLPVISFIDTSGAYPGLEAEERGAAEAIAKSVETCLSIKVPFISIIIGEGGSGGAIAIAASNTVLMLEHAIYSVISPEGCASILWHDAQRASDAANALKLTAQSLKQLGVIDEIIDEPLGAAHRSPIQMQENLKKSIIRSLKKFEGLSGDDIVYQRREKFLQIGEQGF